MRALDVSHADIEGGEKHFRTLIDDESYGTTILL